MQPTVSCATLLHRQLGVLPLGDHRVVIVDDLVWHAVLQDDALVERITRSQNARTSPMLWVTRMIDVPCSLNCRMRSKLLCWK